MRVHCFPLHSPWYLFKTIRFTHASTTTYSNIISSLKLCSTTKQIHQSHGFIIHQGIHHNDFLLSQFIHKCCSLGFYQYAISVFTHTPDPSTYLHNTMIKALSKSDSGYDPISIFNRIQVVGLRPDSYSFPFVLKAVTSLSTVDVGRQIHCLSLLYGLDSEVNVATALIRMYSNYSCILDARKVFDATRTSDVAVWNAMVAGYVKVSDIECACQMFELMPIKTVISWTTLIAGYAQNNCPEEAVFMFRKMQIEGVEPDEVALLAALSACADLGALDLGEWIHNFISKHKLGKNVRLNNALVDMYSKCGKIEKAFQVFSNTTIKNVVTWTTMIAGFAFHGLARKSLEVFSRMEKAMVKPNQVTFVAVLSACSHAGLVETGLWYFNNMESKYGIKPKIEHYGCIVDLLGRGSYLLEAKKLVESMPFMPNAALWGSLLAASKMHGNIEIGSTALRHLIKMEPNNSGNYMVLSNIYATFGRWNDSITVRKMMRMEKLRGVSFIEVNNVVFEFVAGDMVNPQFEKIHTVICIINEQSTFAYYDEYTLLLEEVGEG